MSVFVVDNELGNSVRELGEIIDQVQGNNEFSSQVTPHIAMNGDVTNKAPIVEKIYESTNPEILKKLNDKDFEPAFNLIVFLLVELQGGIQHVLQNKQLLQNLIACSPTLAENSIRDKKSIKPTTILSELTLIFNLLPETSELRFSVLQVILQFFNDLQLDFKIISNSFGPNLLNWLTKINNVEHNQIKRIFWDFILLDKQLSLSSLYLINDFTAKYDLSLPELHKLITFSLNSKVIDLSFMINNKVSKSLISNKSDPMVDLFLRYLNCELLETSDFPLVKSKSKILSLCKFFETSNNLVFQYNDIPVDRAELEVLVINAIKNNLIEGKLDQVNETFKLIRVNKFIIPFDDSINVNLQKVRNDLLVWRNSLVNVNKVVEEFRDSTK